MSYNTSCLIFKNNMIATRNNINHIIHKFSKYIQSGGEKKLEQKMKDNEINVSHMKEIKNEIDKFDTLMNNVKNDLDVLISEITKVYKSSQDINKNDNKSSEIINGYQKIKKLISIDDDNNLDYYESQEDFNPQNLMLVYYGLIEKSQKFLDSKSEKDFNNNVQEELTKTIEKINNLTVIFDKYTQSIEDQSEQKKKFENKFIIDGNISSQIKTAKVQDTPKNFKKEIVYYTKSGSLIPVNLESIVDLGKKILRGLEPNDELKKLSQKSEKDLRANKNIFMTGGDRLVIEQLNRLIASINKCNYSLQRLNEAREKYNKISKEIDDFVTYMIGLINTNPRKIYTHISKNIIKEYLTKINKKLNEEKSYYFLLNILQQNFSLIADNMGNEVLEIKKLDDQKMINLFTIFNNFYPELDK